MPPDDRVHGQASLIMTSETGSRPRVESASVTAPGTQRSSRRRRAAARQRACSSAEKGAAKPLSLLYLGEEETSPRVSRKATA